MHEGRFVPLEARSWQAAPDSGTGGGGGSNEKPPAARLEVKAPQFTPDQLAEWETHKYDCTGVIGFLETFDRLANLVESGPTGEVQVDLQLYLEGNRENLDPELSSALTAEVAVHQAFVDQIKSLIARQYGALYEGAPLQEFGMAQVLEKFDNTTLQDLFIYLKRRLGVRKQEWEKWLREVTEPIDPETWYWRREEVNQELPNLFAVVQGELDARGLLQPPETQERALRAININDPPAQKFLLPAMRERTQERMVKEWLDETLVMLRDGQAGYTMTQVFTGDVLEQQYALEKDSSTGFTMSVDNRKWFNGGYSSNVYSAGFKETEGGRLVDISMVSLKEDLNLDNPKGHGMVEWPEIFRQHTLDTVVIERYKVQDRQRILERSQDEDYHFIVLLTRRASEVERIRPVQDRHIPKAFISHDARLSDYEPVRELFYLPDKQVRVGRVLMSSGLAPDLYRQLARRVHPNFSSFVEQPDNGRVMFIDQSVLDAKIQHDTHDHQALPKYPIDNFLKSEGKLGDTLLIKKSGGV